MISREAMPNTVERQAELLGYCPYLGITQKRGLYDLIEQLPVKITRPDQFYANLRRNARGLKLFGRFKIRSGTVKKPRSTKNCELYCGIQ